MISGMKPNIIHVMATAKGDWSVRKEGAIRALGIFRSQAAAAKQAVALARKTQGELYIHGRDGMVRERSSYRPVPCPPGG